MKNAIYKKAEEIKIGDEIELEIRGTNNIGTVVKILSEPSGIDLKVKFPNGYYVFSFLADDEIKSFVFESKRKIKYAFICSPFAGDTERNITYAIKCCKEAIKRGYIPIAPHLYFPQFLDDNNPEQREMGLTLGRESMKEKCEIVLVGDKYGISEGMKGDLDFADKMGIPVEYLTALNGFNKSEVIMAIRLVLGIVNAQGYKLDVYEYSMPNTDILRFNLFCKDKEHSTPVLECDSLYEVISYIQTTANNRVTLELLDFLKHKNTFFKNILSAITAPIYVDFVATGFGNNKNVIEEEIEI